MDSKLLLPDSNSRSNSKKFEGSPNRLIFATLLACVGPFTFGYTIGYSSPVVDTMIKEGMLDSATSGWFGSLVAIGAMVGGPVAALLVEKLGRKKTIMLTGFPFLGGWASIYCATSILYLLLGRILCGIASGMITVAAPIYIAEISTKTLRGFLGAFNQLSITIGILVVYALGMRLTWNYLALVGVIPSLMLLMTVFVIPETPRFLLMHGKKQEALKSLAALRGPHTDVQEECRDIEEGLDTQESFSFAEFKRPELYRPLFISMVIMVFQQFSGINAVMFYTVMIFESAGFSDGHLATVAIGAVQVVATFLACLLMDRAGRRFLLISGGLIMSATCFAFAWYYHTLGSSSTTGELASNMGWLAILSLVLYIIGFSLGWGPIPMLVMSEIFPARARGTASGMAILCNWVCAFIVTKEFIFLKDTLGPAGTFCIFGGFCFTSVVYVYQILPETKGKSLEDIELYFLGKTLTHIET